MNARITRLMHPVLYSFRRCPYAMRARLALASAGITCALREILLRDKAAEFLQSSPKGTVPVLVTPEGRVIDESYEIMLWALERHDPENWLDMPREGHELIARMDGPFKTALDRYKYATRYEGCDPSEERTKASNILMDLDARLTAQPFLFGDAPRLADMAILPFIRQFANTDRDWFDAQDWPDLSAWLNNFTNSDRFARMMVKHPKWTPEQPAIKFP